MAIRSLPVFKTEPLTLIGNIRLYNDEAPPQVIGTPYDGYFRLLPLAQCYVPVVIDHTYIMFES